MVGGYLESVGRAARECCRLVLQPFAYDDTPLPIGFGKISQPFIVAVMTDLLDIGPTDTVLEIGIGLGYQSKRPPSTLLTVKSQSGEAAH